MQPETVGEVVRLLRSRRRLEQVELARLCGWRDASAVSRIETDRVRPTRRTLLKLAESLAQPGVTGERREVLGWLFLAAGIPPSADDVEAVSSAIPPIEAWPYPAAILDFSWTMWRANEAFRRTVGLPPEFGQRNYLEALFQEDGPIRSHLGAEWEQVAEVTLRAFRARADARRDQRWHKRLLVTLRDLPGFNEIWERAAHIDPPQVYHRSQATMSIGRFGVVALSLTADPRLHVVQGIPEDEASTRTYLERLVPVR